MKSNLWNDEAGSREVGLSAFILYEDKPTGLRAKLLLDRVLRHLDADANPSLTLWRLDLLAQSHLRKRMARGAAQADLVLVSLHGTRDLSADMIDWLYLWLHQPRQPCQALAILLDQVIHRTVVIDDIFYAFSCFAYAEGLAIFSDFREAIRPAIFQPKAAPLAARLIY